MSGEDLKWNDVYWGKQLKIKSALYENEYNVFLPSFFHILLYSLMIKVVEMTNLWYRNKVKYFDIQRF